MSIPDSLTHKLALYESRGHVPYYKDGLFSRDSWLAVLFGQGLMPRAHDRLADVLNENDLEAKLRELYVRIATNVASMSSHEAFIARYCGHAQESALKVTAS
jgi:tryptophan halogenase